MVPTFNKLITIYVSRAAGGTSEGNSGLDTTQLPIRFFPVNPLFASGGRSIGASALAAVCPMNIQGCFPLRLTDLIALQSKGLSRVFSSTTVLKLQRYHFFPLDLNILYRFLIYIYISEHLCFLNIPRCGVCLCIYLSKQFLWYFGKK